MMTPSSSPSSLSLPMDGDSLFSFPKPFSFHSSYHSYFDHNNLLFSSSPSPSPSPSLSPSVKSFSMEFLQYTKGKCVGEAMGVEIIQHVEEKFLSTITEDKYYKSLSCSPSPLIHIPHIHRAYITLSSLLQISSSPLLSGSFVEISTRQNNNSANSPSIPISIIAQIQFIIDDNHSDHHHHNHYHHHHHHEPKSSSPPSSFSPSPLTVFLPPPLFFHLTQNDPTPLSSTIPVTITHIYFPPPLFPPFSPSPHLSQMISPIPSSSPVSPSSSLPHLPLLSSISLHRILTPHSNNLLNTLSQSVGRQRVDHSLEKYFSHNNAIVYHNIILMILVNGESGKEGNVPLNGQEDSDIVRGKYENHSDRWIPFYFKLSISQNINHNDNSSDSNDYVSCGRIDTRYTSISIGESIHSRVPNHSVLYVNSYRKVRESEHNAAGGKSINGHGHQHHQQQGKEVSIALPSPSSSSSSSVPLSLTLSLNPYLISKFSTLQSYLFPYLSSSSSSSSSPLPLPLPRTSLLLYSPRRMGKCRLLSTFSSFYRLHYVQINSYDLLSLSANENSNTNASSATMEELIHKKIMTICGSHYPLILHIRRLGAFLSHQKAQHGGEKGGEKTSSPLLLALKDINHKYSTVTSSSSFSYSASSIPFILVVGSAESSSSVPLSIRGLFTHSMEMETPEKEIRKRVVEEAIKGIKGDGEVENKNENKQMNGGSANGVKHIEGKESQQLVPFSPSQSHYSSSSSLFDLISSKTAGLPTGDILSLISDTIRISLQRNICALRESVKNQNEMVEMETLFNQLYGEGGQGEMDLEEEMVQKIMRKEEKKEDNANAIVKYQSNGLSSSSPPSSSPSFSLSSLSLLPSDFDLALSRFTLRTSLTSGVLSTVPNVKWSDVGGLEYVKKEIMDIIEMPKRFPQLFQKGVKKRSGMLLFGPPGTGKTLIAKAVATECQLNFLSVKGPELLNQYVGESEKNVREVFQRARNARPSVIFFDELDALAPSRGNGNDGGGVMDRVVSQLLTEMDGMDNNEGIYVIGATNRPDLLDSSLMRPGRFDRCVYLGIAENDQQQLLILSSLTRKFTLHENVKLSEIVSKCAKTMSGADFYALATDSFLNAIKRKIEIIEEKGKESKKDVRQIMMEMKENELRFAVCHEDFEMAVKKLVPSLSKQEIEHYLILKEKFANKGKV